MVSRVRAGRARRARARLCRARSYDGRRAGEARAPAAAGLLARPRALPGLPGGGVPLPRPRLPLFGGSAFAGRPGGGSVTEGPVAAPLTFADGDWGGGAPSMTATLPGALDVAHIASAIHGVVVLHAAPFPAGGEPPGTAL